MAADVRALPARAWRFLRRRLRPVLRWLAPRGWPVAAIAIGLAYVVLSITLPPPATVSVIDAESESLRFDVMNPDLAAFRLGGMRLIDPDADDDPACIAGLLVPALDARVTYRLEEIGLVVGVRGTGPSAGRIEREGPPLALPAEAWLVPDAACPGHFPRRLPVVGPTVLGEELRPESLDPAGGARPLVSGTIAVYGRAIEVDIGIYSAEATLYPVSEIELPGGSRLFAGPADGRPPPWHGFVTPGACDPDGTCAAFAVQVSTGATTLHLVRPGVEVKPEVIAISTFARLFSDPSIVFLWVLVGVLSLIIQTMGDASDLFAKLGRGDDDA